MANSKRIKVNDEIKSPEVRLIDKDGNQIGILALVAAQAKAKESDLDLVEVSPNSEPPVCRILDYGRFVFEQTKGRGKSSKQHTKKPKQQVKEVKFRPNIDVGDFNVKIKMLLRFISLGHKVKITIRFRGREMTHQNLGLELIKRIEEQIEEKAIVEQQPKQEGRQLLMVVAPRSTKTKKSEGKNA